MYAAQVCAILVKVTKTVSKEIKLIRLSNTLKYVLKKTKSFSVKLVLSLPFLC